LGDVTAVLCVTHIVTTGKAYGRYIIWYGKSMWYRSSWEAQATISAYADVSFDQG
jgi:hypothetical protein